MFSIDQPMLCPNSATVKSLETEFSVNRKPTLHKPCVK